MDDTTKALWTKLRKREVDINNQQLFFATVAKGFIYTLNQNIIIRDKFIPHFILNTGDDIMFLEVKGQDHSKEPLETVNENFVYSMVPRCMVTPSGITIQTDQLTNPYAHGIFQVEYEDMIYNFRGEFRRIPLNYSFSLKYYLDNYTDALDVVQQIIANLAFVNRFNVSYLGQLIECSYNIPDSENVEYTAEFDGITTESKYRTISMDLDVQTNLPVIYADTLIPADAIIKKVVHGIVEYPDIYKGIKLFPKGGIDTAPGELSNKDVKITIGQQ